MLMTDIIAKKRDGGELTAEEIGFVIDGYTGRGAGLPGLGPAHGHSLAGHDPARDL